MSEKRAPYNEAPEKWKRDVIQAVRSKTPDSITQLYGRWCQLGYTPRLVVRCMELPYIVVELSESERARLAQAIRCLDQELGS